MIKIELSFYRKARIWTDNFPNACFDSKLSITETFSAFETYFQSPIKKRIAIELSIPVGGRIIYGLLGAEFISHEDNTFLFEVFSSDSLGIKFESMNKHIDIVHVGLPLIYSKAIKDRVLQYFNDEKAIKPRGKLVFNCAAYGEVGSNEIIFEQLSIIICNYLFLNQTFKSKEDYIKLFSSIIV